MAESSRVNKYKQLRESIKEEAGIQRDVELTQEKTEDDDFLAFIPKKEPVENDTLVEAITFEQLKQQQAHEVDRVLRSVKTSTGKEEEYNTRLDILSKIRNPQTVSTQVVDDQATSSFEMGHFTAVKQQEPEVVQEELPKMTLMERLSAMSPKEDVKKVQEVLDKEPKKVEKQEIVFEVPEKEIIPVFVKEPKVVAKEEVEMEGIDQDSPLIKILNYIIVALVVVFVVLCGMIVSQIFM